MTYYRQNFENVLFVVASDDQSWCHQHLSAKEIPFDIFKCIMDDESIPQLEKNYLIQERGDKRYKVKEVAK